MRPPPRLCIIDYGMGNLNSVRNALMFLGYHATITRDPEVVTESDAYILPGVGAFGQAIHNLQATGLAAALAKQVIDRGKPFLGICLGLQLLALDSEELGHHEGLGWIEGHVYALQEGKATRVPHVGWSELQTLSDDPLFTGVRANDCFYFDHSYHLECADKWVLARCRYGSDIIAAIRRDNIMAVQFHPEKSQRVGLRLLRSFLDICDTSDGDDRTSSSLAPAVIH